MTSLPIKASTPETCPSDSWAGINSDLTRYVAQFCERTLNSYREQPAHLEEHANRERWIAQGGYSKRQVFELVQNGADEMIGDQEGRIDIRLTTNALYCANSGRPATPEGVRALLMAESSSKQGPEIGRFGLGFKSVLEVTDRPEFYSRTGSFGFDPEDAERRIRCVVPDPPTFPKLRLATILDAKQAAEKDPVLAGFMEWAATVIKLPLDDSLRGAHLSEALAKFPAAFLLFSRHVRRLTLDDETKGVARELCLETLPPKLTDPAGVLRCNLVEGDETPTEWVLLERMHIPGEEARADAGGIGKRSTIPVTVAVQIQGRLQRGEFWAFFPTDERTSLSAIVNTFWKTNSDRRKLLDGPYNRELLDVAAKLVVEYLPALANTDQPGRIVDLMPSRAEDAVDDADLRLGEAFFEAAARNPSLPDQNGTLRRPPELKLHPEGLPKEALESWKSFGERPADWIHHELETKDRRARVNRLFKLANKSHSEAKDWLASLCLRAGNDDATRVQASLAAIATASHLWAMESKDKKAAVRGSKIVLNGASEFVEPDPEKLHFASESESGNTDDQLLGFVHLKVAADEDAQKTLQVMGIKPFDAVERFRWSARFLFQKRWSEFESKGIQELYWKGFWQLARNLESDRAREILRQVHEALPESDRERPLEWLVRVFTMDGTARPLVETLLPGRIIPPDSVDNHAVAIDIDGEHKEDKTLLLLLNAKDAPGASRIFPEKSGLPAGYWNKMVTKFHQEVDSKAQERALELKGKPAPGPLEPLAFLSPIASAAFTIMLAEVEPQPEPWRIRHKKHGDLPVPPPHLAMGEHLRIQVATGGTLAGEVLHYKSCMAPSMKEWAAFFPIANCSEKVARRFGLADNLESALECKIRKPAVPQSVERCDKHAFVRASKCEDQELVGRFYAAVCEHREPPMDGIRAFGPGGGHAVDPELVHVVISNQPNIYAARTDGLPYVVVATEEEARRLHEHWKLQVHHPLNLFQEAGPGSESHACSERAIDVQPSGPEIPLADRFPELEALLPSAARGTLFLVPCFRVQVEQPSTAGTVSTQIRVVREGAVLYHADSLDDSELVRLLAVNLGVDPAVAASGLRDNAQPLSPVAFSAADTTTEELAQTLWVAIGQNTEALRQHLPRGLVEQAGVDPDDGVRLAMLTLAVFGTESLRRLASVIEAAGVISFAPPSKWCGSHPARKFVAALGFPAEYAGAPQRGRPPVVEVEPPIELNAMHPYQVTIAERLVDLLRGEHDQQRALLSLPTGAGKTRVAVEAALQAATEATADGRRLRGPVLWVAQQDELCEQAVDSWCKVWRARGPQLGLRVNRLWAGNDAECLAPGEDDSIFQVVVATIDKLRAILRRPERREMYGWLAKSEAVFIDEAHHSVARSYGDLLRWLELTQKLDRCPLVGLTATPFRGGEEESRRLVARYRRCRLDEGVLGDDPYRELQEEGYLARAEHVELQGASITLNPIELAELHQKRLLPAAVEERLGRDSGRNRAIVDAVGALPDSWSVLLFATGVEHARLVVGLLAARDIPAAAVSADTDPAARRYLIREFREGRLRVLANYGVLTAGFDAPAVRAVVVARPVYSPVTYLQMIGRGLRGPKNGGKEMCRILTVQDNIEEYAEEPVWHRFRYLWEATVTEML